MKLNELLFCDSTKDVVSLRAALIYDAVMVFAMAIKELGSEQVSPVPILCNDPTSVWNKGYTILNYMKNVIIWHFI